MLALVLVGALIVQTTLGAPTNCAEFCDESNTGGYGHAKSSYSSYVKSSYGKHISNGGGSGGLGMTGGRLENFDENVIGGIGLNRPGNWQDEKHYVTDDGRGEMSYRAGQTVTNNGYSKYASHSYSYGTHDTHTPTANSQILSSSEFESELQNMRRRISNFMGNFHFDTGSTMNANSLQEFKNKASIISAQMNNVCNQVDAGSAMYQQMQQMMQQFQRDVEQKQQEMEAMIFKTSSSSSSTSSHESIHHYPTRPSSQYAPIQQYPTRPTINEEVLVQQRVEEQITRVQSLISTFYTTFNRPDTNMQYQQDLNAQVDIINQKLIDLSQESIQNESVRMRIDHLKTQFESYVSQIRNRIQEIEQRNREEEARRKERQRQLELEKKEHEEKMRQLEAARLRLQQEEEERKRQQELEEQRRLLRQEEERLRLEQEERQRQLIIMQQQQQQQQQQQMQQQQQPIEVTPQVTGTIEVSGSSSYIKGSYGSQVQGGPTGSSGSYIHGSHGNYGRPQSVTQTHMDLTAAMGRLQQDLHRLQNEVNNFNMYTMRLTSANSATVVSEAERQAEALRQSINNLCETSSKYQNQNLQKNAEDLQRRFEELFHSFQSQAASYTTQTNSGFSASGGYSSGSSYSTSGNYGSVHSPTITNVELEHSKSTEIEIGRRPASSSQRYASGSSYGSSSRYGSSSSYGSQADNPYKSGIIELGHGASNQQVECVEMYAGQPCVNRPRYQRNVAEEYNPLFDIYQQPNYAQLHQPISDDFTQYSRNEKLKPKSSQLEDYEQIESGALSRAPNLDNFGGYDDFSQHIGSVDLTSNYQPIRNKDFTGRVEDYTYQEGAVDDYYLRHNQQDQVGQLMTSENLKDKQEIEDLSQQHMNFGENEDLDYLQKPRNYNLNAMDYTRNKTYNNSEIFRQNSEKSELQQSRYNDQHKLSNTSEKPQQPIGLIQFGKIQSEVTAAKPKLLNQTEEKLDKASQPATLFGKSEITQKFNEHTLEKSGCNDFTLYCGKAEPTESPSLVQPLPSSEKLESQDFTSQNSGFNDYHTQNNKHELNSEKERIPFLSSENLRIDKQTENLTQQSSLDNVYSFSKKVEKPETFGSSDLTQQTAGKIDFGPDSQLGRQFSHQSISKPERFGVPYDKNYSNHHLENASSQTEKIFTTTEYQDPISTVRPTMKPAPKPVPRYSRRWQISRAIQANKPKPIYIECTTEHVIPQNVRPLNVNEHSTHRGDLPGISELSTTPVNVIKPDQIDNETSDTNYDPKQQYEQVNLYENSELNHLQKPRNEWLQNNNKNNQLDRSDHTYHFNQQSIHHNYEYSQQSNYYNQHHSEVDLGQQKPLNQLNNFELNREFKPNDFNQQQGSMNQLHEHQIDNSEIEHESIHVNVQPDQYEQTSEMKFNKQKDSSQQNHQTLFEQQSSQLEDVSQNLQNNFNGNITPLNETKSIDGLSETESTTTPRSFWKRIGHKLSTTYDKAKEKARTIFG